MSGSFPVARKTAAAQRKNPKNVFFGFFLERYAGCAAERPALKDKKAAERNLVLQPNLIMIQVLNLHFPDFFRDPVHDVHEHGVVNAQGFEGLGEEIGDLFDPVAEAVEVGEEVADMHHLGDFRVQIGF